MAAGQYGFATKSSDYCAWVLNQNIVLMYHSGHATHKQYVHLLSPWPEAHDVRPTTLRTDGPIEFHAFIRAVKDWRDVNQHLLPTDVPSLANVRKP